LVLGRDYHRLDIFIGNIMIENKMLSHITLHAFLHQSESKSHNIEEVVVEDDSVEFHILQLMKLQNELKDQHSTFN
jgi:hypothetical protein